MKSVKNDHILLAMDLKSRRHFQIQEKFPKCVAKFLKFKSFYIDFEKNLKLIKSQGISKNSTNFRISRLVKNFHSTGSFGGKPIKIFGVLGIPTYPFSLTNFRIFFKNGVLGPRYFFENSLNSLKKF